jgi:hypothetical protein
MRGWVCGTEFGMAAAVVLSGASFSRLARPGQTRKQASVLKETLLVPTAKKLKGSS